MNTSVTSISSTKRPLMPSLFASFDAWPILTLGVAHMNLKKFARYPLTFGPTPIQPLKRLSAHLGGKVDLYMKREDCNSGLAFGGNKTRQVAAVAAHLGLKCVLVQENWVNYSDAVYDRVGNIEMSRIMGADVRLDAAGFDIGIRKSWEDAMESVRQSGGKPYPIPAGCSEHPKGGLGFVAFAEEVRQQEEELGFKFDYIVTCAVTGSTQAGMVVGFAADGRADRVIGIDASAKPQQTFDQILRIAKNTAGLVELNYDITEKDVVLDTRFGGPEYGLPNEGTLEAIRLCARTEGILTDPVYEGKSMHGMIEKVRLGEFPEGAKVLYAHLGGVPALNAYSFIFRNG